ncbi:hypothetical protein C4D60_Mb06t07980 [Musa balbisiana]|uniref:Uncharacterized protein n=1 Tax=Musa balbisiana TaxID=52838 RepID=A0A4S8ILG0_MUSBA|nr:hypothetical protein C4D60_Mb06t07980 [Musa balbisiana]
MNIRALIPTDSSTICCTLTPAGSKHYLPSTVDSSESKEAVVAIMTVVLVPTTAAHKSPKEIKEWRTGEEAIWQQIQNKAWAGQCQDQERDGMEEEMVDGQGRGTLSIKPAQFATMEKRNH